jgi:tetratricopeptide (TPR) repeat protein
MARPELLDRRSGWGGVLRLQALGAEEAQTLMEARIGRRDLGADVRDRILRAAGGNPLFVEEMAAMVQASEMARSTCLRRSRPRRRPGADTGEVAAHDPADRARPQGLIRPDRPLFAGEDAFRFRHLLMRDAAYDGLPKAERADLHEQLADWLGYHLEQASRYRQELGDRDVDAQALATRAGEWLALAGSRAILRQDFHAALALLERAADLLPDERRDGRFEMQLGWTLFNAGQVSEAVSGLAHGAERAAAAGDRVSELGLRLEQAGYELVFEPTEGRRATPRARRGGAAGVRGRRRRGGLSVACCAFVLADEMQGRPWAGIAAWAERLVDHARRADHHIMADWGEGVLVGAHYRGSTPVAECLRWLDEHPAVERRSVLPYRDRLLAMLGRFDEAHRLLDDASDRVTELGVVRFQTWPAFRRFEVVMLGAKHRTRRLQHGTRVRPNRSREGSATSCGSAATSPTRCSRSAMMTRPNSGSNAGARPRRARSEPRRSCGAKREARCWRGVASSEKASGSHARRSPSPQRRTC